MARDLGEHVDRHERDVDVTDDRYFIARGIRPLGLVREFSSEVHRLITHAPIIEEFTLSEIAQLGEHMMTYACDAKAIIIGEGEVGDFMILVISGAIEVVRTDRFGRPSRIAVVQGGHALGEMSMLDGEPRFASCIALEPSRFAVLTRESLVDVIHNKPHLGAKILMKLVHILSQRLRNTSTKLVSYMEKEQVGPVDGPST
jgi:CRP-like cAMP-binding protein